MQYIVVPSVSRPKKNKNPNQVHRPKNRTNVDMIEGIQYKADEHEFGDPKASKILFLGMDNLERLRGYKAFLELWANGKLCLTITGHSLISAITLFDSIEK